MSGNVPSHSRTRRTHRHGLSAGGSRRSHQHSGYLPPLTQSAEVYEQISIDEAGPVTAGRIAPGAIHNAAQFAQGIQPVLLVDGLPTLPDLGYPEDIIVFDISVTSRVLYKNEADVWVKLVGPDDIQANSITAGQIAAGAVSTSELAVGARLVGEYQNEDVATPGVFIDDTGILIRSGKLTLEDEFGLTTMQASGFAGSWANFVRLGVYNSQFLSGVAGVVPEGRTAALPYYTLTEVTGSPVATFLDPHLEVSFSAENDKLRIVTDPVAVIYSFPHQVGVLFDWVNDFGTTLNWDLYVDEYDDADTLLGSVLAGSFTESVQGATVVPQLFAFAYYGAYEDAISARLRLEVYETGGHSADNTVTLRTIGFSTSADTFTDVNVQDGNFSLIDSFLSLDSGSSIVGDVVMVNEITEYNGNAEDNWTPVVGGSGGATHSAAVGSYYRIGKVVFVNIYLVCNGNGSGVGDITITTPTNPDRSFRQVLNGSITGHGLPNGPISLTAFTSGSGAVWDRLHGDAGPTMTGADYDSGGVITLQGFYIEA